MNRIGFWKKSTGNYMSSTQGLTEQDVEFLKSLEVGDRFVLYVGNKKKHQNSPDASLAVYKTQPVDQPSESGGEI